MADKMTLAEWTKVCKKHDPTDPGLADALKSYAKAPEDEIEEQLKSLEEVVEMAESAQKKNAKNKDVTSYLADVLTEARLALRMIENAVQEPDGILNDEKGYKKYLKAAMVKLKKAPMYFAIGLGQRPEDHRIIFHKSKAGKALLATIKKETDLKKVTWGLAGGHEEEKSTLTLALEGPQIAGLKKKGELFLKFNKPLPFDMILLMVDGEQVADIPDPTDVEGEPASPATANPSPAGSAPAGPGPGETVPEATPDKGLADQKSKLAEALKQLKPAIDKAINVDPNRKNELFRSMTQIAGEIKDGKLDEAKSNIVALGKLVQGLLTQKAAPATPVDKDTLRERFEAARDRIEPKLAEARRANPDKANALLNLWNYAIDQAEAENFTSANTALEKLETLCQQTSASPTSGNGLGGLSIMKLGKARLEWKSIQTDAVAQIKRLQGALREEFGDDDEQQPQLNAALTKLDGLVIEFNDRLGTMLDDVLNAKDDTERLPAVETARSAMRQFTQQIDSDPVMQAIDGNSVLPETKVNAPLRAKLGEIAAALG